MVIPALAKSLSNTALFTCMRDECHGLAESELYTFGSTSQHWEIVPMSLDLPSR